MVEGLGFRGGLDLDNGKENGNYHSILVLHGDPPM